MFEISRDYYCFFLLSVYFCLRAESAFCRKTGVSKSVTAKSTERGRRRPKAGFHPADFRYLTVYKKVLRLFSSAPNRQIIAVPWRVRSSMRAPAGGAAARNAPCGPIRPSASGLWYIAVFVLKAEAPSRRLKLHNCHVRGTIGSKLRARRCKRSPSAVSSAINCAQGDASGSPSAEPFGKNCAQGDASGSPSAVPSAINCAQGDASGSPSAVFIGNKLALTTPRALSFLNLRMIHALRVAGANLHICRAALPHCLFFLAR